MTDPSIPAAFLLALGRLLDLLSVPTADVEPRTAATGELEAALRMLLRQNTFPSFRFVDGRVEYEGRTLDELAGWEWALRLPEAGIGSMDVTPGTTREDLEGFAEEAVGRIVLDGRAASARELDGQSGIRFGDLDVAGAGGAPPDTVRPLEVDLEDEAEAMSWLTREVADGGLVAAGEASIIVQLLSVAMHSERNVVVPLVQLKTVDQYTTTHSMNVSCLSMALAEHLRYASTDVRAIGEAALLHDVGKTRIPPEVLNKKGKLADAEWTRIQSHTVEGARILLASGPGMELPATVALEHHVGFDGTGYPARAYARPTHSISRLVQVCDVYDALRTRRPFRAPWPAGRAARFLREKAGTQLDPEFVAAFLEMLTDWQPRRVELGSGDAVAA